LGGEHALIQISKDTGGKYYYAEGEQQLDEAFRKSVMSCGRNT
jgi:hypothetical protein